ncbi:MAG: hypothetical protein AB1592_11435 [Pseudomonadota bacterium]
MGEEKRRKLARDASDAENVVPGSHAPVQSGLVDVMTAVLDFCRAQCPGYNFTLFAAEPEAAADAEGRLPRFNYMSTADRRDMVAVLKAFVARNSEGEAIDAAIKGEAQGHG